MKLQNKSIFTNTSWKQLCCRRQGEGERSWEASSGNPFSGNLFTAAELKARINFGLGSKAWSCLLEAGSGQDIQQCPSDPGYPAIVALSHAHWAPAEIQMLFDATWSVSSPSDRLEQPWLLLREGLIFRCEQHELCEHASRQPTAEGMPVQSFAGRHELSRGEAEGCVLPLCYSKNQPKHSLPVEDSGCIPRMLPCTRNAVVAQTHHSTSCNSKERMGTAPTPSMEIQHRLSHSAAPCDNLVLRPYEPERARALRQGAPWEPLSSCLTSLEFHVCGRRTLFGFTKESEHLNKVVPPQP